VPRNSALRFKSGKGKSVRIDKIRAQKRKTIRNKFNQFKTVCLTFCTFFLALIFLIGFIIHKKLNENFVSASSYDSYISNYPSIAYIVVNDFDSNPVQLNKVNFLVLDQNTNKVLIFDIPLGAEINLPGKYSDMPIRNIFALGGLNSEDKLEGGTELLNKTLFKMFGFSVDNYILVEESLSSDMDRLVYEGRAVFPFGGLSISDMKSSFKTSFSLKFFYQTQEFLSKLPSDRFIHMDLGANRLTDIDFIDDILQDLTLSSSIAFEKKTIAVLNGTDLPGVANLGSRVIKNIGGRVVSIENALESYSNSVLIADDINSPTVTYIRKAFNIEKVYTKEEASFIKESVMSRSDITFILGFDLASSLY